MSIETKVLGIQGMAAKPVTLGLGKDTLQLEERVRFGEENAAKPLYPQERGAKASSAPWRRVESLNPHSPHCQGHSAQLRAYIRTAEKKQILFPP